VKQNAGDFEVLCSRYSVRSVSHNNRNVYKRCDLYLKLPGTIARRKLEISCFPENRKPQSKHGRIIPAP
jgi:hypothetical protein